MERKTETDEARDRGLAVAGPTGESDCTWGYLVTPDGRVVKVTRENDVLLDGYGRGVDAPVIEERRPGDKVHRAA